MMEKDCEMNDKIFPNSMDCTTDEAMEGQIRRHLALHIILNDRGKNLQHFLHSKEK